MIFSNDQIGRLLNQNAISDVWPWDSNDEISVENHLKDVVAVLRRENRMIDKTEYWHYGSGYASFIDCWLSREVEEFKAGKGHCYWGLVILFSRLSNYYVIGQGTKSWSSESSASYLPSIDMVDNIECGFLEELARSVCKTLDDRDFARLSKAQLSGILSKDIKVSTILSDPPWCAFDALFYWED